MCGVRVRVQCLGVLCECSVCCVVVGGTSAWRVKCMEMGDVSAGCMVWV